MASPSILILGAAGYIGGTVLVDYLQSHTPSAITALVKTEDQKSKLAPLGITVIIGTVEDIPLLSSLVAASDIVLNFAVPFHGGDASIQAIVDGLTKRATISIMFGSGGEAGSDNWKDTDYDRWEALPDSVPFHSGDKIIAKAATDGIISAYIIMTPCVYGVGSGPGHNQPRQMPAYLRWARKTRRAAYIGKGENIWGCVNISLHINPWNILRPSSKIHIKDLSRLYLAVLGYAVANPNLTAAPPSSYGWSNLIYSGVGTQTWKPVIELLGDMLFARGHATEGGAVSIEEGVSDELYMFGGNSYMEVSEKTKELGWGGPQEMDPLTLMKDAMKR
ncbi:hypothetical protein HWV62_22670 [Athelia sp. TMB]|nr:hypothetical protein HWV62_22670 [Athelia sp. TMB]